MVIWRIVDGRPGHDHQSRGLVQALGDLAEVSCHDLAAQDLKWPWYHLLRRSFPPGNSLPRPDFVMGAGRRTHLPVLCARHAHGGRSVILMRPGLPARWFDCCLVPEHDRCRPAANIIRTRGSITMVRPARDHDQDRGLILVGGPSRHYDWNEGEILDQIGTILGRSEHMTWNISDSPRTPETTSALLARAGFRNAACHHWRDTGANWVTRQVRRAGQVWVSADSVSMIHEALTAGANTGILTVPEKRPGKLVRALENLIREGMVTPFPAWQLGGTLQPPRVALDEAGRCARLLLEQTKTASRGA